MESDIISGIFMLWGHTECNKLQGKMRKKHLSNWVIADFIWYACNIELYTGITVCATYYAILFKF